MSRALLVFLAWFHPTKLWISFWRIILILTWNYGHLWQPTFLTYGYKSVNLQYNTLICWADGTNDSLTKCLMFQVFFLLFFAKTLPIFFYRIASPRSIRNYEKKILGSSEPWLTSHLSHRPGELECYRGSLHFMISQFMILANSWFFFRHQFHEFLGNSWFWNKK